MMAVFKSGRISKHSSVFSSRPAGANSQFIFQMRDLGHRKVKQLVPGRRPNTSVS